MVNLFKSVLLSGLRTIRDIWDDEILNFKDSIQIYNSLFEYSQIKAAIPNTYVSILKKKWKIYPEIKLEK